MIQTTERNVCGSTAGHEACAAAAERDVLRKLLSAARKRYVGGHTVPCMDDNPYWPECTCGVTRCCVVAELLVMRLQARPLVDVTDKLCYLCGQKFAPGQSIATQEFDEASGAGECVAIVHDVCPSRSGCTQGCP